MRIKIFQFQGFVVVLGVEFPSFVTITGKGDDPTYIFVSNTFIYKYIYIYTYALQFSELLIWIHSTPMCCQCYVFCVLGKDGNIVKNFDGVNLSSDVKSL